MSLCVVNVSYRHNLRTIIQRHKATSIPVAAVVELITQLGKQISANLNYILCI